jgi:hypothetical protein
MEEIIKCNEDKITSSHIQLGGCWKLVDFGEKFRYVGFYRELLQCWWVRLTPALHHLGKTRDKLICVLHFCGIYRFCQGNCRANGQDCVIACSNSNLLSVTIVSRLDARSKARECSSLVFVVGFCKYGSSPKGANRQSNGSNICSCLWQLPPFVHCKMLQPQDRSHSHSDGGGRGIKGPRGLIW